MASHRSKWVVTKAPDEAEERDGLLEGMNGSGATNYSSAGMSAGGGGGASEGYSEGYPVGGGYAVGEVYVVEEEREDWEPTLSEEEDIQEVYGEPAHRPYFVLSISAVQLGMYVIYALKELELSPHGPVSGPQELFFMLRSDFPECADVRGQFWRYFTYSLVHAGLMHVLLNMVAQFFFGILLEHNHGHWRVALVYFMGVIGGSLACGVSSVYTPVIGCSGGVYSMVGMHIANLCLNWRRERMFRWGILVALLLSVGSDLRFFGLVPTDKQVSYSCHTGGMLVGFFAGMIFLKSKDVGMIEERDKEGESLGVRFIVSPTWVASLICLSFYYFYTVHWIHSHWPPEDSFNMFWSPPKGCCWLGIAEGTQRSDYECTVIGGVPFLNPLPGTNATRPSFDSDL